MSWTAHYHCNMPPTMQGLRHLNSNIHTFMPWEDAGVRSMDPCQLCLQSAFLHSFPVPQQIIRCLSSHQTPQGGTYQR